MANQRKEELACLLKTVTYIYFYMAIYMYTPLCQATDTLLTYLCSSLLLVTAVVNDLEKIN